MKKQMRWPPCAANFPAFFAISMANTQMIPFLSRLGYTMVQRGYVLIVNAAVAIVGQFLFGYLRDRFQRVKVFLFTAYVLLTASSFAMLLAERQTFWYHVFTVALMSGMVKAVMGLGETWMLEIDQENYGRLWVSGALGLTIGSPVTGYLARHFHYKSLPISLGIVSVILRWLIYKTKDAEKKEGGRIRMESVWQLLRSKGYLLLVLVYPLVYMIGTTDRYVVIDKVLDIGADATAVGIKQALQSLMEVPLFPFSSKILEHLQTKTLLYFGTLMYSVKFLFYGFSFQPWMVILTAALQLVTLPIIALTSRVLVREITPQKLFSSTQMFVIAIFIGVSGLITPPITFHLSKAFGYDWTLCIVAAFSIVPLLLIFCCVHYF